MAAEVAELKGMRRERRLQRRGRAWEEAAISMLRMARRAVGRAIQAYLDKVRTAEEGKAAAAGTTVAVRRAEARIEKAAMRREAREAAVREEVEMMRGEERRVREARRGAVAAAARAAQKRAEDETAEAARANVWRYYTVEHRLNLPLSMWKGNEGSATMVKGCRIVDLHGEGGERESMSFRVAAAVGKPQWKQYWCGWSTVVGRRKHGTKGMAAELVQHGTGEEASGSSEDSGGEEELRAAERRRAARRLATRAATHRRAARAVAVAVERGEGEESEEEEGGGW